MIQKAGFADDAHYLPAKRVRLEGGDAHSSSQPTTPTPRRTVLSDSETRTFFTCLGNDDCEGLKKLLDGGMDESGQRRMIDVKNAMICSTLKNEDLLDEEQNPVVCSRVCTYMPSILTYLRDHSTDTPLHWAAALNSPAAIRLLLCRGADANTDLSVAPLMAAVTLRNVAAMEVLLSFQSVHAHGINEAFVASVGEAFSASFPEAEELLLQYGAHPHTCVDRGHTALRSTARRFLYWDRVRENPRPDVALILLQGQWGGSSGGKGGGGGRGGRLLASWGLLL